MDNSPDQLNKLRWRCRRGIKEVEIPLQRFFEQCYVGLDAQHQALFQQLLTCDDVDLFEWLTRRSEAADAQINYMVDYLLRTLAN